MTALALPISQVQEGGAFHVFIARGVRLRIAEALLDPRQPVLDLLFFHRHR